MRRHTAVATFVSFLVAVILIALVCYYVSAQSRPIAKASSVLSTCGVVHPAFLNAGLNGSVIKDRKYSAELADSEIIEKFYYQAKGTQHGYVVGQTNAGNIFICDMKGTPGALWIDLVKKEAFNPGRRKVFRSRASLGGLKEAVHQFIQTFSHYVLGLRDCKTFAQAIAAYLLSLPPNLPTLNWKVLV